MLIRHADAPRKAVDNCHDGRGRLHMTEMLGQYDRSGAGIRFIHDNVVEPGATIGEHTHHDDDQLEVIAPEKLRDVLCIEDGDTLAVVVEASP